MSNQDSELSEYIFLTDYLKLDPKLEIGQNNKNNSNSAFELDAYGN